MSLGAFARYNINWFQLPAAKRFMDKIKRDVEMGHGDSLEIMKKHAYMAKIYGLRFGSVFYLSLSIGVFYYTSVFIYERIVPTNETRLKTFPITTEYLILEEKCRLLTFLHMNFSMILFVTIFVGTETLSILYLEHAISLSEITSYYVRETIFRNSKYQSDDRTRRDIAKAVIAHNRGLEYIQEFQDNNAFAYALLLVFAVTSLAINLFRFPRQLVRYYSNNPKVTVEHDVEDQQDILVQHLQLLHRHRRKLFIAGENLGVVFYDDIIHATVIL
ncbi:hypothetical protein K0M31_007748 [Melipona bicolor]|uniref:Uncharacterized protein n=1 Tax=Melipona bicolor TaxID=60889 RepID=A0AA40GC08_9HYME|nr:hypothetical protein K0M31_007748 [Melipona bicolor]